MTISGQWALGVGRGLRPGAVAGIDRARSKPLWQSDRPNIAPYLSDTAGPYGRGSITSGGRRTIPRHRHAPMPNRAVDQIQT